MISLPFEVFASDNYVLCSCLFLKLEVLRTPNQFLSFLFQWSYQRVQNINIFIWVCHMIWSAVKFICSLSCLNCSMDLAISNVNFKSENFKSCQKVICCASGVMVKIEKMVVWDVFKVGSLHFVFLLCILISFL